MVPVLHERVFGSSSAAVSADRISEGMYSRRWTSSFSNETGPKGPLRWRQERAHEAQPEERRQRTQVGSADDEVSSGVDALRQVPEQLRRGGRDVLDDLGPGFASRNA